MQKSQRPNAGPSAYFRNRQNLLAVTASAALLAGIASANALPLTQQYEVGRSAKPNGAVLASRDKSSSKVKPAAEDVAARAKGILSVVIAIDRHTSTLLPARARVLFPIAQRLERRTSDDDRAISRLRRAGMCA